VQAVEDGACFPNAKSAPRVYCIGPVIAEPQESGTTINAVTLISFSLQFIRMDFDEEVVIYRSRSIIFSY